MCREHEGDEGTETARRRGTWCRKLMMETRKTDGENREKTWSVSEKEKLSLRRTAENERQRVGND